MYSYIAGLEKFSDTNRSETMTSSDPDAWFAYAGVLQGYPSEPKFLSSLINQQQTKTIYIRIKTHYFVKLRPGRNQSKRINQTGKLLPDSANRDEIPVIIQLTLLGCLIIGQLETINSLTARVFAWKSVNFRTISQMITV